MENEELNNEIDRNSFIGTKTLNEEVDMKKLRAIAENFSEVYKRLGEEFWKLNTTTGEYNAVDEKTAESIMKELYQSKRKSSIVHYRYSGRTTSGRRFSTKSLQGLSRKIRHTIAKDIYYDLDIANAHPTFLQQLCKKMNFENEILDRYITNRDELLQSWIGTQIQQFDVESNSMKKIILQTKDDVKCYFLKMVNGGGNNKSNNSELNQFHQTQQLFLNAFFEDINYKRFREKANRKMKEKKEKFGDKTYCNAKGTAINYYLCEVEDQVLTHIEEYLTIHKIEYGTLCFDGIMVYIRCVPDVNQLLTNIETHLKHKMDYSIRMKHKVMDEGIDISDLIVEDKKENRRIVQHNKEAGDLLYEEIKNTIVYSEKSFYRKVNLLWISEEEEIKRDLRKYVMEADLWKRNANGILNPYSQNAGTAHDISTVILDNTVASRNNQFENIIFESSKGKILFRNGYFDIHNGYFLEATHPAYNHSIVFTEDIPYDFDPSYQNNDYVENIKQRLFTIPFGYEMGQYYLLKLSRAIAGDREKKFLVGIGSSNTGKSALASVLKHTIGGYFGAWNGANICYKPNSSQDEAQKLRWLYLLRNKRIIVSSELQVGGMGIDGNMIKKLSNGGLDPIVARQHCGNELSFKIGFLPILFAQDLDKIRPIDDAVMTRLRAINYQKVYVDEPSNDFELQIDRNLDNEVQTDSFKMAFLTLLFQTYKQWNDAGRSEVEPECVHHQVKEIVGVDTNIITSFLNDYEITNDPNDYVKSSDVEKWITDGKFKVTMSKFGMEMNKYCKINHMDNVESKNKKIGGKAQKCWFGVRLMSDDDEKDNLPINRIIFPKH